MDNINKEQQAVARLRWNNALARIDELDLYDGEMTMEYIEQINNARNELYFARLAYVAQYGTAAEIRSFERDYGKDIKLSRRWEILQKRGDSKEC